MEYDLWYDDNEFDDYDHEDDYWQEDDWWYDEWGDYEHEEFDTCAEEEEES